MPFNWSFDLMEIAENNLVSTPEKKKQFSSSFSLSSDRFHGTTQDTLCPFHPNNKKKPASFSEIPDWKWVLKFFYSLFLA